ncbi:MAG: hypothetical protein KJ043_22675, partial [Anaerolineae bacterium]|nr:hypothetical protein [Anaerolineae bacterium]
RRSFNDYTFYASPYLRHTLFLGSSFKRGQYYKYSDILYASRNIIPSVYFGFPEGWGERMMPNDEVWVTPQNDQDNADAPRIRLIPYENLGIYFNMRYSRDRYFDIIATRLRYIHQLDSTFEHYLEYHASQSCVVDLYTYPYESNGRKGYITLSDYSSVILEVSVPTELFDVYEKVLRWSADSFRDVNAACG